MSKRVAAKTKKRCLASAPTTKLRLTEQSSVGHNDMALLQKKKRKLGGNRNDDDDDGTSIMPRELWGLIAQYGSRADQIMWRELGMFEKMIAEPSDLEKKQYAEYSIATRWKFGAEWALKRGWKPSQDITQYHTLLLQAACLSGSKEILDWCLDEKGQNLYMPATTLIRAAAEGGCMEIFQHYWTRIDPDDRETRRKHNVFGEAFKGACRGGRTDIYLALEQSRQKSYFYSRSSYNYAIGYAYESGLKAFIQTINPMIPASPFHTNSEHFWVTRFLEDPPQNTYVLGPLDFEIPTITEAERMEMITSVVQAYIVRKQAEGASPNPIQQQHFMNILAQEGKKLWIDWFHLNQNFPLPNPSFVDPNPYFCRFSLSGTFHMIYTR
jgi:hypothetical protein